MFTTVAFSHRYSRLFCKTSWKRSADPVNSSVVRLTGAQSAAGLVRQSARASCSSRTGSSNSILLLIILIENGKMPI